MIKLRNKISVMALILFSVSVFAQQNSNIEKDVHIAANKILTLCKMNKFSDAAVYIAYHGTDKKRENKDHYNPNIREEKSKINRICRKIRSLEVISKSYEIGKVKIIKGPSSLNYSVKIKFRSSDQTIGIKFIFVKVKGNYLLSDID